jgi:hypothetical protein
MESHGNRTARSAVTCKEEPGTPPEAKLLQASAPQRKAHAAGWSGGAAAGGGRSEVKRSRAGPPHGEPRTESPSEAAQPKGEPRRLSDLRERYLDTLPNL